MKIDDIGRAKKTKACLNLDHWKGDKLIYPVVKVHFWQTFRAEIVQAKNETIVQKILKVRESFES